MSWSHTGEILYTMQQQHLQTPQTDQEIYQRQCMNLVETPVVPPGNTSAGSPSVER